MTDEVWKAIPGFEGLYEVSDHGRVRSLDRIIERANRWGSVTTSRLTGRVRKLTTLTNGYVGVVFSRRGKCHMVHRLVAMAFLPNPDNLPEVNHKDLRRDHNRPSNLEWVSRSRNKLHSYESGTRKQHAKTTRVVVTKGSERMAFESELDAARHLGRSVGTLHSALTRNHLCAGYAVEYA